MLRLCTENEFDRYIDFAYSLAMDPAKSGYPTYCDGIKTKTMFVDRTLEAFERETEQLLLFEHKGEVRGLIHFFLIPDDRYIQTICFNIQTATGQALSEFLAYVSERFKGYDLYMGFPAENREAVQFLAGHGFACIENDWNNTAFPDRISEIPAHAGMIRIRRENFEKFRFLHDQAGSDIYWNSDRILDDLDNWNIFVREQDGEPLGAVCYVNAGEGSSEIFAIDINHQEHKPELFRELLETALLDAKQQNRRTMTFFCEEKYEDVATACGFQCVGNYLCYKTRLE